MTDFAVADTHFDHADLLQYCNRPFQYIKEWNQACVANWNSVVTDKDTVYFTGDFHMSDETKKIERWLRKLNGKKHMILGNHDRLNPFTYVNIGFQSVHTALWYEKDKILLAHDPAIATVLRDDQILLCGHVHNLFDRCKNAINVGVDVRDYTPVRIDQLREEYGF